MIGCMITLFAMINFFLWKIPGKKIPLMFYLLVLGTISSTSNNLENMCLVALIGT